MRIEDIAGSNVKISRSTITALNDAGRTAGMVTGVETYYNMAIRDKLEFFGKAKQAGVNNWSRLFRINARWYYIADDAELARAREWASLGETGPTERLEEAERAAAAFGSTVIRVARADDTRKK